LSSGSAYLRAAEILLIPFLAAPVRKCLFIEPCKETRVKTSGRSVAESVCDILDGAGGAQKTDIWGLETCHHPVTEVGFFFGGLLFVFCFFK